MSTADPSILASFKIFLECETRGKRSQCAVHTSMLTAEPILNPPQRPFPTGSHRGLGKFASITHFYARTSYDIIHS